ncbi:hypothetical protein [Streptomyces alanosinicus]|uniref:hypothetical protein n=1 Tax=Streptomyces alanosinicus TaxID=68171 RepID=UPI00167C3678|nr:hypothetical protein [Streptomyces alanosinicus]
MFWTAWWKGEGEFEGDLHGGQSDAPDLGAQDLGPFFHASGAGLAQEVCDLDGEGGGAQVEAVQEVAGEGDFVVGLAGAGAGVGEGGDEGALGLGDGPLAGDGFLFGPGAGAFVGGGRAVQAQGRGSLRRVPPPRPAPGRTRRRLLIRCLIWRAATSPARHGHAFRR